MLLFIKYECHEVARIKNNVYLCTRFYGKEIEKKLMSVKMKGKRIGMGLGMLLASTLGMGAQEMDGASAGTMNLTLQKAIEIALAENPTIRVADKDIELKKLADTEAWQNLLPTVDATLSLTDNILVAEMVTGMGKFKMGVDAARRNKNRTTILNVLRDLEKYQKLYKKYEVEDGELDALINNYKSI